MKRTTMMLALALVASVSACGEDVTTSDEYQALEQDVAALEQRLSDANAELAAVPEVPDEVVALLGEWWAANERRDGSVVELYLPSGYHLYGDQRIELDQLAAHLDPPGWTHEWISEPYLIAAEPEGRYVVALGVRNTSPLGIVAASALTFEITTTLDGDLGIVQTTWLYVH